MGWTSIRSERKNQQRASLCDAAPLAVLGAGRHPSSQDGAQQTAAVPLLQPLNPFPSAVLGLRAGEAQFWGTVGWTWTQCLAVALTMASSRSRPLGALSPWHPHSAGQTDRQGGQGQRQVQKKEGWGVWKRELERDDQEKEDEWNGLDRRTALTFCPVSHSLFLSVSFILKIIFLPLF